MKNNSFMKHFTIIGIGTALNMIIGLITTPIITRIVDPVEYGKFSLFTMYSSIIVMILCLGLDQGLIRYYYNKKDENYKKKLLFLCAGIPSIIYVLLSLIVLIIYSLHIFSINYSFIVLCIFLLYTFLQLVYRFSLLIVRLEYKSKAYSLLNVLVKIFYVGFAILLIYAIKSSYFEMLAISITIATLLCLAISIILQKSKWNFFSKDVMTEKINMKELLTYSLPFIITMGVTTLFQAIDKISLSIYCDYADVGIYSSTMTLVHIFAIVQTTFNTLWAPMAVEHYTKKPEEKTFFQKANSYITIIMFFIGISLILVKDVFAILLGEKYRLAAYILPFLIFNPIMYTISETTVNGLVFMKKSKTQILVATGACLTNIIGNIILVPWLGCKGAAISTGISYIVFFTLRTLLSNKYYYVDFKLSKFYILTLIVGLYALYNTFIPFSYVSIVLYFVILAIMLVLYYESIDEIIDYIKKFLKGRLKNDK